MKKRVLAIAATAMATMMMASPVMAQDFKIGICNYVDDASLNQIVDNIQSRLEEIGKEKDVNFDVSYDNCNADANVMEQIISDFQADNVDLMVGIATPVAMRMQSATEGTDTPVVFSAVSDPVGSGLVEDLDAPGANITGTSDYLDTASIMKLIQAVNPDVKKIGLLYDIGQDSSTTAIQEAKDYLDKEGIEYVERTGTTTDEVQLAADALVAEGTEAGGHIGENTTMVLVPQVVDAVNVPVIAAGGIADGRGMAAAFMLGAKGVQMGTHFVVTDESQVHENYKERIIKAKDIDSRVTGRTTGHPVRALRNDMTRKYLELENAGAGFEELEKLTLGGLRKAVVEGDVKNGSVMAGQIAGMVKERMSCKDLIQKLITETDALIGGQGFYE